MPTRSDAASVVAAVPGVAEAFAIGRLDGHDQAALLHSGQVTPAELVEAAIVRIEQLDPALNAIAARGYEHARTVAGAPVAASPGGMAGVPYLLKESLEYPGFPVPAGSRARNGVMATRMFPLAGRFQQQGLIPVGMSTMPEFGLLSTGETLLHGATRNPWALDRSAGGSSTGAAAAVASGMVPFAHASDAAGSIRLPASCCGVIGLKPGRGANVRARAYNLVDDMLCSDGLYARTVRDADWAFRIAHPDHRPDAPVVLQRPIDRPLRIAVIVEGMQGDRPDPDVEAVIDRTAALCAGLGHHVERAPPPVEAPGVLRGLQVLWIYLAGETVDLYAARNPGVQLDRLLEPWTLGLAEARATVGPEQLGMALAQLERAAQSQARCFEQFDVVLSPVASQPALPLGQQAPTRPFAELWQDVFGYVSHTPMHNMSGTPSLSLPLYWTAAGLPVGSMFSAGMGGEDLLLRLAYQLEAASPWKDRWPAVTEKAALGG